LRAGEKWGGSGGTGFCEVGKFKWKWFCYRCKEDILKNLACANEGSFAYKIVVKNRISVQFSEKSVWSVVGRENWEAAVCD